MSEIESKIPLVIGLLKDAAKRRNVVRWRQLFEICDSEKEDIEARGESYTHAVFYTLEKASSELCEHSIAVYASLIERPKKGFFAMHTIQNRNYFKEIAGSLSEHELVDDRRYLKEANLIIATERDRVWKHAAEVY